MMRMSIRGLMALIHSEAVVLTRYLDSAGVWTIGIGHTAAAGGIDPRTFKGALTIRQVIELLETDIKAYEADVNRAIKVPITQCQFDALVHFHYNSGGIGRAKLTASINRGAKSRQVIRRGFMGWLKPPSLKGRRETELDIFFGDYPPADCSIYKATKSGKVRWASGRRVHVDDLLNRQKTTVADLRARGSRHIKQADVAEVVGVGAGGIGAVEIGLDVAERVQDVTTRGAGLWDYVHQFALPVTLLVAGAGIVYIAVNWKRLRLNVEQTGAHI